LYGLPETVVCGPNGCQYVRAHQLCVVGYYRYDVTDRFDRATAELDPPLAVVDLDDFDANAAELVRRAGGLPVRVASKSVRCRALVTRALATAGFHGVLAYTLAEALWLTGMGVSDDVVVGYPTADSAALRALARDGAARSAVTIMVDCAEQLELVDAVLGPDHPEIRVCLELDASWRPLRGVLGDRLHVGTRRSPVFEVADAVALARAIADRPGFRLAGMMAYEGQIAGVGDAPAGRPVRSAALRWMQEHSAAELAARRAEAVSAVGDVAKLEFVNGGGTGSLERTAAEGVCTEAAAGSGLYGPTLFDGYTAFRPRSAARFALPVVRRPGPGIATVLGGGYIASGPAGPDRVPTPVYPPGLRLFGTEGAGEVQTPLAGPAADRLSVGDRVWFRHAKAGELCEHFDELHLVRGDRVVGTVPTYRGEHRTFL
jgi:D-serine deaminase-like pyridoxal phosphate-dependent protein